MDLQTESIFEFWPKTYDLISTLVPNYNSTIYRLDDKCKP